MVLFDTHCHLQDMRIKHDIEGVIDRSIAAGVTTMLCCGSTENDWPEVLAIADQYSCVLPAIGLHPWFVASRSTNWLSYLEELLRSDPTIAIGEIGLDHTVEMRNDAEQMTVFYEQLKLAQKLKRPVSMHCRRAWGSLLQYLRSEKSAYHDIVIHSYSGPVDLVKELEHFGIMFSFSGSITYEDNLRGRASAKAVHLKHLVLETDSPDMQPVNYQGVNEPSTLPSVAGTLAVLRAIPIEEIAATTTVNAKAFFHG
jgi:TatD DNase family protein